MSTVRSFLVRTFPALLLASTGAAEVVVVDRHDGPGTDYVSLGQAIAESSPGDVLIVRESAISYLGAPITHALEISAEEGANVRLTGSLTVEGLAAGERVVLRGLHLESPATGIGWSSLILRDNEGTVWIEDCLLRSEGGVVYEFDIPEAAGILAEDSDDVVVIDSIVEGNPNGGFAYFPTGTSISRPAAGIQAVRSHVVVYSSSIVGGADSQVPNQQQLGIGAPGVFLEESTLFASDSSILGGEGVDGGLFYCGGGGGPGVRLTTADSSAALHDSVLSGGLAGVDACGAGPGADPEVLAGSLEFVPGVARSFAAAGPVPSGGTLEVGLSGEPGDLVVLTTLAAPGSTALPGAKGFLLGLPGLVITLGVMPPSGNVAFQVPAPALVADTALQLPVQAIFATPTEILLAPGSSLTFYAE